jgi:DNA-binding MarR family transcriptional regulator
LINRMKSQADSRMRVVQLTQSGLMAYREVWPQMSEAEDALFVGLSKDQRDGFLDTLSQILLNIRKHDF